MYVIGCVIAFCLYFGILMYRLCESPAKIINMEKIHRYYEIRNGNYKDVYSGEYVKPTKLKIFFKCIGNLVLNTILSWIYVIITAISLCISFIKKNNFPKEITEKMKEYDLKLSVTELSKKEVQHIIKEQFQLLGNNEMIFSYLKNIAEKGDEYIDYISLMDKNERSEYVCIVDNFLIYDSHNPSVSIESVTQYKLEGENFQQKLLQEKECDYYNGMKRITTVKDGKINEKEVDEPKEYNINKLKKSIQWNEGDNRILVKSLVFIHESPTDMSRNYIKERIKEVDETKEEYIKLCKSYGFDPLYEKDGSFKLLYGKEMENLMGKEKIEHFEHDENYLMKKYGFDISIRDIPHIKKSLTKMLENLK